MTDHRETVEITDRASAPNAKWERPAIEVICLACEISAYAPDDGGPLF